jgi:hypothetical protein
VIKFLLFAAAIAAIWWVLKSDRAPRPSMSAQEAARILGIAEDSGIETIVDAHRKLIAKVHPDTGGTSELAARVNEARDLLLARITQYRN